MCVTTSCGQLRVRLNDHRFELRQGLGTQHRDALAKFADVRGIRIEDDVLVTADGREVLTAALAKQPDAVEALVNSN